jgi:formate hydrogenlyase subunit 3/multisubunit Na+/H+ antiporter MnhD subunit
MNAPSSIDPVSRRILLFANVAMLLIITVHDADHIRQATNWCYRINSLLWIVNVSVYLPSAIALLASWRRWRWASLATAGSALLIAVLFAHLHLWKPLSPVWGIWNSNFFVLQADAISWSILALTVLVGVGVAMAATWTMGRNSR